MGWRDDYRARVSAYGGNIAGSYLNSTKEFINNSFINSPSYRLGKLNGVDIDFLYESGNNKKDQFGEKVFTFRPDALVSRGDIVTVDTLSFLITDLNDQTSIAPIANALLCNDLLKWKDENGNILSYPCSTIAYRSLHVIKEDSHDVNIPEGHMMIAASLNSDTMSVRMGQRFFFGNQTYEITGIDDATSAYNGIGVVTFTVGWTPRKDKDDFENRIADNESLLGSKSISNPPPVQSGQGGGLWS